jgi:hypothetical protein
MLQKRFQLPNSNLPSKWTEAPLGIRLSKVLNWVSVILKSLGSNPNKTKSTKEFDLVSNKLGTLADGTRHNVQPQLIY